MNDVDVYLAALPDRQQAELRRIRSQVKKLVPDAEESISYMMPTYKYKKKPLVYYAAFKNHMSLFPTQGPADALMDKLKDYKISKGTIKFTLGKPLPDDLITEIVLTRKAQIDAE
jgi:uncharacterized protein YdhG (YjbR/CyaY superfamily)